MHPSSTELLLHRVASILTLRCGGAWRKNYSLDEPFLERPFRPGRAIACCRTAIFVNNADNDDLDPFWTVTSRGPDTSFCGNRVFAHVNPPFDVRGSAHAAAALVEKVEQHWEDAIRRKHLDDGVSPRNIGLTPAQEEKRRKSRRKRRERRLNGESKNTSSQPDPQVALL